MCSVYQRTLPDIAFFGDGIGAWTDVLESVCQIGRWTCVIVPVYNLPYFDLPAKDSWVVSLVLDVTHGDGTLSGFQKLILVFFMKQVVDSICGLVDNCYDAQSETEKLLVTRHSKALSMMHTQSAAAARQKRKAEAL